MKRNRNFILTSVAILFREQGYGRVIGSDFVLKKKTRNHRCLLVLFLVILVILTSWIIWGNITVGTTLWDIHDTNLPSSFEGYKIAQISDLHNAEFGQENSRLLKILQREAPDIIVFTGDLVDSGHTDIEIAVSFAKHAMEIAPCYYVTGNHEAWLKEQYSELEKKLEDCGVRVLRNQSEILTSGDDRTQLIGIDDPDFSESDSGMFDFTADIILSEIESAGDEEDYKILLSHRPEVFDTYVEKNINLVLCGHAHGGQFRFPFLGGIVAPNQGLFPEYDGGLYRKESTTMVVSRGIGNSILPVRFNNRPEVVVIVLHS